MQEGPDSGKRKKIGTVAQEEPQQPVPFKGSAFRADIAQRSASFPTDIPETPERGVADRAKHPIAMVEDKQSAVIKVSQGRGNE